MEVQRGKSSLLLPPDPRSLNLSLRFQPSPPFFHILSQFLWSLNLETSSQILAEIVLTVVNAHWFPLWSDNCVNHRFCLKRPCRRLHHRVSVDVTHVLAENAASCLLISRSPPIFTPSLPPSSLLLLILSVCPALISYPHRGPPPENKAGKCCSGSRRRESHLGDGGGTKTGERWGKKDIRGEAMRGLASKARWDGGWQRVILWLNNGAAPHCCTGPRQQTTGRHRGHGSKSFTACARLVFTVSNLVMIKKISSF